MILEVFFFYGTLSYPWVGSDALLRPFFYCLLANGATRALLPTK